MKIVLIALATVAVLVGLAFALGPREPVAGEPGFVPEDMGRDLDAYLYDRERRHPDLIRGAQKHILWADPATKAKTPLSIVYVHGFSATLQEIRPVPDRVAQALGANLYFTRLAGHGRDGEAMAEATVPLWMDDMAEALEIGRRIGERVIVMGTSTGGTLTTMALFDDRMNADIAGVVMISPNFGLRARGSRLLTFPFARTLVPALLGRERGFAPENPDHAKWWTERYPTVAVLPMAAAVKAANALPHGELEVPALFIFSDADQVVNAQRTRRVAGRWGGRVSVWPVAAGRADDRMAHVVAGDILSPGLTEATVERILEWVRERGI